MKKNIKVLLKRAKALFLAYVLVLGSFSSVAPFLFAQKVGAIDSDSEYALKISPDGSKNIIQKPGEPILFRARVVANSDPETTISALGGDDNKAYIFANYDAGRFRGVVGAPKRLGKIVQVASDRTDCSGVDMSFANDEDTGSVQVDLSSGDRAEASFCYVISTDCVSSVTFKALFPEGSLDSEKERVYTKELVVRLDNENTGLNFNMSESFNSETNELIFKWDAFKNSDGVSADKYKVELAYYPTPSIQMILHVSDDIWSESGKDFYTHNFSVEELEPEFDTEYGWCVSASYSSGDTSKYCSPLRRFDLFNPTIVLNGEAEVNIEFGGTYTEELAKAYDSQDGDLTDKIIIGGNVDAHKLGRYVISYDVTDNSDKKAKTLERIVNVMPRKVTVKIKDLSKIFGESDPAFEYQIIKGGLLEGDDLGLEIKRVGLEEVGLYNITGTASLSLNPNYYVLILPGTFTITEKPAEIAVAPEIIETVAAVTPTTYYDRVGVVDTGEQESAGTVETKEEIKVKKEEVKKTWKILGATWYWWILITAVLGALSWWFSPVKPAKDGKDTTNSSDK